MFIWLVLGIALVVIIGTFIYLSARKAKEEGKEELKEDKEDDIRNN